MKVYLKIYDQYWTGRIRSAKDGSKVYFVLTPRIENAKDLGSEENAMNQLEWWCVQCGADPKEWRIEYGWDEHEQIPFCKDGYIGLAGGEYVVPITDPFFDLRIMINSPITEGICSRIRKQFHSSWTDTKEKAMRSLTDICKTADKYYDNSVELFNLLEEVKSSDLSDVNYSFAIEYINEKIEALKDKLRTRKVRRDFDED